MSLVSIIIPCYNYGWLLSETLDSVLAQTHQQWECIVIDDGSVDTTRAVAESYGRRDARFRYVYQTNAGMSAARNRGLLMAEGDYIQFLDADDLLAATKLVIQVQVLTEHPEFDLVYGSVRYFRHEAPIILSRSFDMQDTEWQSVLHGKGAAIVTPLVKYNRMVINAPLLRAELVRRVGPFVAGLRSMEDWEFWLRCALAGAYFHYDDRPETWAFVRVHPTSTSQNRSRMQLSVEQVRASLTVMLDSAGLSEAAALNKELLQQQRNLNAKNLLCNGELKQGLGKYWHLAG